VKRRVLAKRSWQTTSVSASLQFQNIERGANYPSFENFIKILNYIGASPNEVMLEIVDKAEATKTNELWDNIQDLDLETKKKILKIVEVLIEK
jgi:hypothetical protein